MIKVQDIVVKVLKGKTVNEVYDLAKSIYPAAVVEVLVIDTFNTGSAGLDIAGGLYSLKASLEDVLDEVQRENEYYTDEMGNMLTVTKNEFDQCLKDYGITRSENRNLDCVNFIQTIERVIGKSRSRKLYAEAIEKALDILETYDVPVTGVKCYVNDKISIYTAVMDEDELKEYIFGTYFETI